jgi:hypothetical protein
MAFKLPVWLSGKRRESPAPGKPISVVFFCGAGLSSAYARRLFEFTLGQMGLSDRFTVRHQPLWMQHEPPFRAGEEILVTPHRACLNVKKERKALSDALEEKYRQGISGRHELHFLGLPRRTPMNNLPDFPSEPTKDFESNPWYPGIRKFAIRIARKRGLKFREPPLPEKFRWR